MSRAKVNYKNPDFSDETDFFSDIEKLLKFFSSFIGEFFSSI